jgi:predicted ATPase/DNA-binding CsgD family transcriptional regulator
VGALDTAVTPRESEVLALVGQHLTNVQIAHALVISVRTVESHVASLLRKYQVTDRRSLARLAAESAPARHALPMPVTPFLGRATERSALAAALDGHRLVTAVGPGGIGKTRLAISVAAEIAEERRDGAWFVDLVPVTDPGAVAAAVAEAVGVVEQLAAAPQAALVSSLASRDGVLLLDNCEHLVDGVRECIDQIVAGCPNVTVLATSRTRLMVPYEKVYSVPGLSVTDDGGGDAVALFAARAGEATGETSPPAGERVASLCRALDGMALAIELAASRYATLGLDGLEAGLQEQLRFLAVGGRGDDRHQSLRDTIGWSYDLLDPADQALLRGIAVFASWFDVDAAHSVVTPNPDRAVVADGLSRLADHSLLIVDRGEATRYRALETIRQYGEEQLDASGERTAVQARHDAWCREVLTELEALPPDDTWCTRFDRVVDDARAALLRGAADPDRAAQSAELAARLAGQLWLRGRLSEAQRRYEQAAELSVSQADAVAQLRMAAGAAHSRYAGVEVLRLLRSAADLALSLGDRGGAAYDLAWMSFTIDRAPGIMAEPRGAEESLALRQEAEKISDGSAEAEAAIALATACADYDSLTVERVEEIAGLARQTGDRAMESAALDLLIAVYLKIQNLPAAVHGVGRREAVIRSLPMVAVNGFEHSDHHQYACEVLIAAGDLDGAGEYADRLARLPFNREEAYLGRARRMKVDALAGRFDAVLQDGERFRTAWERAGRPVVPNLSGCAYAAAMVHGILGDDTQRQDWVRLAVDLHTSPELAIGAATGYGPTFDALVALHHSDPEAALRLLAADLHDPDVWGAFSSAQFWRAWYAAVWAEASVLAARDDAPERIERARQAARDNPIAAAMIERAAAMAARDRATVENLAETFDRLSCPYQRTRTLTLAALID